MTTLAALQTLARHFATRAEAEREQATAARSRERRDLALICNARADAFDEAQRLCLTTASATDDGP
jgi:hypothetical protein